jgi:hypothetical protein
MRKLTCTHGIYFCWLLYSRQSLYSFLTTLLYFFLLLCSRQSLYSFWSTPLYVLLPALVLSSIFVLILVWTAVLLPVFVLSPISVLLPIYCMYINVLDLFSYNATMHTVLRVICTSSSQSKPACLYLSFLRFCYCSRPLHVFELQRSYCTVLRHDTVLSGSMSPKDFFLEGVMS